MEINEELLEKISKNAKIELTEQEKQEFFPQLKEILEYFSELDSANTQNIHPTFQPIKLTNIFREDTPKECLTQEQALKNTKHKKDGFFIGPKTFWKMIEEITHALIIKNGKYLAVRGAKDWYWKLPGGGIEKGETPEIALERELTEELGITKFTIERKLTPFELSFKGRNFRFYPFIIKTNQQPHNTEDEDNLSYEWQSPSRMLNKEDQAPSQQVVYEKLKEIGIV